MKALPGDLPALASGNNPDKDVYEVVASTRLTGIRAIRLEAEYAGLAPKSWLGTETIARMLGLRVNHLMAHDERELQVSQPATRAEAAYSLAQVLSIEQWKYDTVLQETSSFALPDMTTWQQIVVRRALRFVGSPYVWA